MEKLHEHCGVMAVRGPNAIDLAMRGALYLQRRGNDAAGIAALIDGGIKVHKDVGACKDVLTESNLKDSGVHGDTNSAISHVRWTTLGKDSDRESAHPIYNNRLAFAFNGTIWNYDELDVASSHRNDTDSIFNFINSRLERGMGISNAVHALMEVAMGGYAMTFLMQDGTLVAARDPNGIRPLVLGKVDGNLVVASESFAIQKLGGTTIRAIRPGEVALIPPKGDIVSTVHTAREYPCIFETLYFAMPRSIAHMPNDRTGPSKRVRDYRYQLGYMLGLEHPAAADGVIAVRGSAKWQGRGYADGSGIPLIDNAVTLRNRDRSYTQPTHESKVDKIERKFKFHKGRIEGKSFVVVDDTIVSGETFSIIVHKLRENGALELHGRVASPPIINTCYAGARIEQDETIAWDKERGMLRPPSEIGREIGLDSLGYLSPEGLHKAMDGNAYCAHCLGGESPIPLPAKVGLQLVRH